MEEAKIRQKNKIFLLMFLLQKTKIDEEFTKENKKNNIANRIGPSSIWAKSRRRKILQHK